MTKIHESLGVRERVALRTVWPNELDFSRWLATNIEILDEHLACEIDPESVQQEVSAGPLRVDLLVEATVPETGERVRVVIENQLETTDGSHLAGVMAYMVAFEAKATIWIAGDVSREYVDVMRWLNDQTHIDAYLFKLEAIRVDTSRPIAILTRIVGPSRFARTGRWGGDPKRNQQVRNWWGRVLPALAGAHPAWRSLRPTAHQYPDVPIPGAPKHISWYVNVEEHKSSVGIKVSGGTKAKGDHYFNQLAKYRDKIHAAFGESLEWGERSYASGVRWICTRVSGGFADDAAEQEKTARAIAAIMKRLVAATEQTVRDIQEIEDLDDDTQLEGRPNGAA